MRTALAPLSLGLLLSLVVGTSAGAQTPITTVKITDNVYMLKGRGGNLGLSVGEDGAFLIDDQYSDMVPQIREAVAKLSDKTVSFLINTHLHGDHTGGNELFGKAGAVIVAHENVRRRMSGPQFQEAMASSNPPSPDEALPIVTFNDTVTFHWNNDEVKVFHVTASHTDGDSVIHFVKANVMHMGDVFRTDGYPYVDIGNGGDYDGIIAASKRVHDIADDSTKIIPGHGDVATRADLKRYIDVLETIRARFVALIEQGKTEDEVVDANPTKEWDATWGQGFMDPERFTRIVYQSLSGK